MEGNFHSILVLLDCMEGTSEEFVERTEAVRRCEIRKGFSAVSSLGVPPGTLNTGHQRRRSVPDVHPGALRIGRRNVATVFCAQPGETVGVYPGTWTIRGGKNCTKAREFLGANNLWGMLPPSFIPHHTIISDSLSPIHPTKQQPILTTYTTMQTTI